MSMKIEKEAAEALLDVGVSVPFKELRLPWRKKPLVLRFRMGRPRLGGQIRIARLFASLGVTHEELEKMTEAERLAWLGKHGRTVSKIVALTVCKGKWSGLLLSGAVAWLLRWAVDDVWLEGSFRRWTQLLGTRGFESIIALSGAMNPLKPTMTSHEAERS